MLYYYSPVKTKFSLNAIRKNIPYRPEGYYEDVISRGTVVGDYLELDQKDAFELINKYHEKSPANGKLNNDKEWGPILWGSLHSRTREYSCNKDEEKRWLNIFHTWIPCGKCKSHWAELLKKNPPELSTKEKYVQWAIDMHNQVNLSLGKPIYEPAD